MSLASEHFSKQNKIKWSLVIIDSLIALVIWDILQAIPKQHDLQFSLWEMVQQWWWAHSLLKIPVFWGSHIITLKINDSLGSLFATAHTFISRKVEPCGKGKGSQAL